MSIVVLYATVSGRAETLAELTLQRLGARGLEATLANVAEFSAQRLQDFDQAFLVASTWGEGAAPPDAADFLVALQGPPVLPLSRLSYAVLALGSRAYPEFCGFGRQLDAALEACGATRLLARVDCDTKLKADFERWLEAVAAVAGKS